MSGILRMQSIAETAVSRRKQIAFVRCMRCQCSSAAWERSSALVIARQQPESACSSALSSVGAPVSAHQRSSARQRSGSARPRSQASQESGQAVRPARSQASQEVIYAMLTFALGARPKFVPISYLIGSYLLPNNHKTAAVFFTCKNNTPRTFVSVPDYLIIRSLP